MTSDRSGGSPQGVATDETSTATPRDVATAIFEALNRHNLDTRLPDTTPTSWRTSSLGASSGASCSPCFFAEIFAASPGFTLEVVGMVCDGEHGVVQPRATGTFTGTPFYGIHATESTRPDAASSCAVTSCASSRANSSTTPSTTGFLLPFAGNPNAAITTAMYAPLAVQEVVLAGSLILRGFRTANTPTRDGRTS